MIASNRLIDDYIEKSEDFAKPILIHIRKLVHTAHPDIEETMKWSFPHFEYKGTICSMASFKQHCAFGFWKASIMSDPEKILKLKDKGAMGNFDRIASVKDLPADKIMIDYIREAVRLNEEEIKLPAKPKAAAPKKLEVPAILKAALKKNAKAQLTFEAFSYSYKKEYVEWLTEAKSEVTRNRRLSTIIKWLAEEKSRNWKYER